MKAPSQKQNPKLNRQQSDIIIDPDGTVHVSFFWDDLKDLTTDNNSAVFRPDSSIIKLPKPTASTLDISIEEYRKCNLCPKKCGVDRASFSHPRCGDWKLRVANSGISLGDEPEIAGTRGSGAVMFSGCPLTCPSCHNPEMVQGAGEEVTPEEFISLCWDLAEKGAHNLQLLSPTVHFPALRAILANLKSTEYPLPIVFKSSGFEDINQLQKFEGLVDVYLPDFKFGPCSQWAARAGAKSYFEQAQATIAEMIRQRPAFEFGSDGTAKVGVLVRHVRPPLPKEELMRIDEVLEKFKNAGARISVLNNFVSLES
jgi:putative pyruvate formate lyase activating enzyme